jgi:hypothetical protein
MEASDLEVSVVAFGNAGIQIGCRHCRKGRVTRLSRKGCGIRDIGIKEIGGIYMRIEVHVALGRNVHSCHRGVGHAERVHKAVVAKQVLFLLRGLGQYAGSGSQEAGIVLFLKCGIIGIIRWQSSIMNWLGLGPIELRFLRHIRGVRERWRW